jgi:hypothetical protein
MFVIGGGKVSNSMTEVLEEILGDQIKGGV